MKKVTDLQAGTDVVNSDISSMLEQLQRLESHVTGDGDQSESLTERVNTALSKLPPNSLLHARWQKTQSQYEEAVALINNSHRSEFVEARKRSAPTDGERTETLPGRSSANVCSGSSTQTESIAGASSPPVCHVKPTQVLNETITSSSSAPFDLRNYLIDKNAPIVEPLFKPQLPLRVHDRAVKSSEMTQRRLSADAAADDARCMRLVGDPVRSTCKAAASTPSPNMPHSRWKAWRKKAVSLLTDGLASGHSASHSQRSSASQFGTKSTSAVNSSPRSDYSYY